MTDKDHETLASTKARRVFGAELRRLREATNPRISQTRLADLIGYSDAGGRTLISKAENANGEFMSAKMASLIDKELGAGGRLVRLHRAAKDELARERGPRRTLEPTPTPGPDTGAAQEQQGYTTDRRQALTGAATLTIGETLRALADRVLTSDPTPLRLAEVQADVHRAAEEYISAPRALLRAQLTPEHRNVEAMLEQRLSRQVRDQLAKYAGYYCYYLGWLSYCAGDKLDAYAYLMLLQRHADDSNDPVLIGSAAELHTGFIPAAADVVAEARHRAGHPYTAGFLAAKEARAAALLGERERARAALADMEAGVWYGQVCPGPEPFDEEMFHSWSAIILNAMREGEAAEGHVRSALALLGCTDVDGLLEGHDGDAQSALRDKPILAAGSLAALSNSYLFRRRPDPVRAAAAAKQDLSIGGCWLTADRAGRMWRDLHSRWPSLPAVRDLGEMVTEARKALPASV